MTTVKHNAMTNHSGAMNPSNLASVAMLAARVLLASIFVLSGLSKIVSQGPTEAYMQALGIPGALLWPAILFEIVAGMLVIMGYQTRIAALLMAGFCLVTAAIFHHQFSDQIQMIMLLKNVSMAGGFLLLASVGGGPISLEKRS
jgi:putative oxidoreductase